MSTARNSVAIKFIDIEDVAAARVYRDAWNELAGRSEFPNIYSTWEFFESWWLAYGTGRRFHLTLGLEAVSGKLRLIAPMYAESNAPEIRYVVGYRRADYCQIVAEGGDPIALRAWFEHLCRAGDWQQINITRDPGTGLLEALPFHYGPDSDRAEKIRAWAGVHRPLVWASTQPSHPFIGRSRFGEYVDMMQRRSQKKHLNWFSRQGKVEFRTITAAGEIHALLPRFFELHIHEWAARDQVSMFQAASNRHFYGLLTDRLAPAGAVSMDVMTLDGRMVAAHYGFEAGGRFYYMKPCFDHEFRTQSPGKLLLAYLLQRLHSREVQVFDFLNGLEDYKFKYTEEVRSTTSVIITRSRLRQLAGKTFGRRSRPPEVAFE